MGFGPSDLAGAVGRFAHLTPPVGCHNALIGARPEAIADGRHEQAAVVRGSDRLVIIGGVAAIIGGLCWAVKAAALITTRMQPPVIYDVAPLFFPVAVVGLSALLLDRRARKARGGSVSACVAELAAVVSVLGLFLGPVDWTPTSGVGSRPVTILTPVHHAGRLRSATWPFPHRYRHPPDGCPARPVGLAPHVPDGNSRPVDRLRCRLMVRWARPAAPLLPASA